MSCLHLQKFERKWYIACELYREDKFTRLFHGKHLSFLHVTILHHVLILRFFSWIFRTHNYTNSNLALVLMNPMVRTSLASLIKNFHINVAKGCHMTHILWISLNPKGWSLNVELPTSRKLSTNQKTLRAICIRIQSNNPYILPLWTG